MHRLYLWLCDRAIAMTTALKGNRAQTTLRTEITVHERQWTVLLWRTHAPSGTDPVPPPLQDNLSTHRSPIAQAPKRPVKELP